MVVVDVGSGDDVAEVMEEVAEVADAALQRMRLAHVTWDALQEQFVFETALTTEWDVTCAPAYPQQQYRPPRQGLLAERCRVTQPDYSLHRE